MKINFGGAFERVIWTVIETFSGMVVAGGAASFATFDWRYAVAASAGAGVVCLAKIFGVAFTGTNTTTAVSNNDVPLPVQSPPADFPSPPQP